jgi:hypothetical protein
LKSFVCCLFPCRWFWLFWWLPSPLLLSLALCRIQWTFLRRCSRSPGFANAGYGAHGVPPPFGCTPLPLLPSAICCPWRHLRTISIGTRASTSARMSCWTTWIPNRLFLIVGLLEWSNNSFKKRPVLFEKNQQQAITIFFVNCLFLENNNS